MQALSEAYSDPWDSWCPPGMLLRGASIASQNACRIRGQVRNQDSESVSRSFGKTTKGDRERTDGCGCEGMASKKSHEDERSR